MNNVTEREPIGFKDVNGNDIHLGDLVEFYLCPFHGPSKEPAKCAVRMVDFVSRQDIKTPIPGHFARTYYFVDLTGHGAKPEHFAGFCRVVGSFPKDIHLLVDQIPREVMGMMGGREKLIEKALDIELVQEAA